MEENKSRAMTFEVDEAGDTIALYGRTGILAARYSEDELVKDGEFPGGIESYAEYLQGLGYRQVLIQHAEEQRSLARLERLRTLEVADRNCAMRPSDEIPPAPLPVEKVGGFDAFKGWASVERYSADREIAEDGHDEGDEWTAKMEAGMAAACDLKSKPAIAGLVVSPDLKSASHQVHYEHGSAVWAGEKKK